MQKYKKLRLKALCLTLSLPLILSGCNNSAIEVRDRAFIQAIGIDGEENPSVVVSIFGNDDNEDYSIYGGEGKTIFEAIADAETKQDKNLFIGHIELIALGKRNLREDLEILLSNSHISPSCTVVYSDMNAGEIISDKNSWDLLETIKIKSKNGYISRKSVINVLDDLLGSDKAAAIPIIEDDEINMAIIGENGLKGILTKTESQGLSWLSESIKTLTLPIEMENEIINLRVESVKSRVTSAIDGNKITTTFYISFTGDVLEKNYTLEQISESAQQTITSLCQSAVQRTVHSLNVDVLNIEKSIKAADYNFYIENKDNWSEMLKSVNFKYEVELLK